MEISFDTELFANSLFNLRLIKEISLRKAAKEIGINYATLSRLEKHSIPDMSTYSKCCNWLNIAPQEFFKQKKKK